MYQGTIDEELILRKERTATSKKTQLSKKCGQLKSKGTLAEARLVTP